MIDYYTPTVWAFAAELYAYDKDEQFGYVREENQEEYLERALFLTLCEPMAAHDAEVAKAERERIIALLKESMCDAYGEDCTDNPGCSAQERIFALIKGENE